jgi:hypothetical protein
VCILGARLAKSCDSRATVDSFVPLSNTARMSAQELKGPSQTPGASMTEASFEFAQTPAANPPPAEGKRFGVRTTAVGSYTHSTFLVCPMAS